jgi:hypothetical protein
LREGFNEPGIVGVIAQCLAQTVNGLIEAAVEIDSCARRPKDVLEFYPRQDHTWTFSQRHQGPKGLLLQPDLYSTPP